MQALLGDYHGQRLIEKGASERKKDAIGFVIAPPAEAFSEAMKEESSPGEQMILLVNKEDNILSS